jgi:hypothetical protein
VSISNKQVVVKWIMRGDEETISADLIEPELTKRKRGAAPTIFVSHEPDMVVSLQEEVGKKKKKKQVVVTIPKKKQAATVPARRNAQPIIQHDLEDKRSSKEGDDDSTAAQLLELNNRLWAKTQECEALTIKLKNMTALMIMGGHNSGDDESEGDEESSI